MDEGQQLQDEGVYISAESLGELGGSETIAKFAKDGKIDVSNLGKSYVELSKMMGNSIRVPGEKATVEEVQEYRRKLGVPDDVEGYEIDHTKVKGADKDTTENFVKLAHELGIPKSQAQKIVQWYGEAAVGAAQKKIESLVEGATTALKTEWGDKFDANIADALRGRDELLGKDAEEFKKFTNENPALGNHPILVKAFKKVADLMKEHKFVGDRQQFGSTEDVDKRIRDIESDPAYVQRNHPNWEHLHQERDRLYRIKYPSK